MDKASTAMRASDYSTRTAVECAPCIALGGKTWHSIKASVRWKEGTVQSWTPLMYDSHVSWATKGERGLCFVRIKGAGDKGVPNGGTVAGTVLGT